MRGLFCWALVRQSAGCCSDIWRIGKRKETFAEQLKIDRRTTDSLQVGESAIQSLRMLILAQAYPTQPGDRGRFA